MAERPTFSSALPPSLVEKYHIIPESDRERFEISLHRIKRWGEGGKPEIYGDVSYLPKPPGFSESDLEHTIGILGMVDQLERFYPIDREVDWDEVRVMAVMHDAGEIRVGDAPNSGPIRRSPLWTVRKNYESVVVYDLISKIRDSNLAIWATSLYDRYITNDPKDKEARVANVLDKGQGTFMTGPWIFNNFRQFGHDKPSDELTAHVTTSLEIVNEKTLAALESPLSLRASLNLRDYIRSLFSNLDQEAYRVPLKVASMRLDWNFTKAAQYKS